MISMLVIEISDNSADGLISIDINAGYLADCADNSAGGFITDTNDGNLMDCADITI